MSLNGDHYEAEVEAITRLLEDPAIKLPGEGDAHYIDIHKAAAALANRYPHRLEAADLVDRWRGDPTVWAPSMLENDYDLDVQAVADDTIDLLQQPQPLVRPHARAAISAAVEARTEAAGHLAKLSTEQLTHIVRRAAPDAQALLVAPNPDDHDPHRIQYQLVGYVDVDGNEHSTVDGLDAVISGDQDEEEFQDLLDNVAEHHALTTGAVSQIPLDPA